MTEISDEHLEKVHENNHLGRLQNPVNGGPELTDTERFMSEGGVPFVQVFLLDKHGQIATETHVDDPNTLPETIAISMARTGARYAVWPDGDKWALTGKGKTRHYQNREAAEMVAIHKR